MKRRQFIAVSGMFAAAATCVPDAFAVDDESSVKKFIEEWYSLFYIKLDKQKYRRTLTDDYLLLENGEIFDADGDIAFMPKPEDEYKRTDVFTFRSVKIHGEFAYAVYFLKSDINDKPKGKRDFTFLESTILRRHGGSWRVALLHSTRLAKP
jgi:hypothetical protein